MFENDININGKHATYMKFLVNDAKVFKRYIDVFMNGAIIGFLYGRDGEKDNQSTDRARIYADVLANERSKCDFIFRLIMLLDEKGNLSIEDKVDRAFRADSRKDENFQVNNLRLFNSYVLGGIEVLFEKLTEGCTTQEDYINKMYEFVSNMKEEMEGIEYDEKLKDVLKGY